MIREATVASVGVPLPEAAPKQKPDFITRRFPWPVKVLMGTPYVSDVLKGSLEVGQVVIHTARKRLEGDKPRLPKEAKEISTEMDKIDYLLNRYFPYRWGPLNRDMKENVYHKKRQERYVDGLAADYFGLMVSAALTPIFPPAAAASIYFAFDGAKAGPLIYREGDEQKHIHSRSGLQANGEYNHDELQKQIALAVKEIGLHPDNAKTIFDIFNKRLLNMHNAHHRLRDTRSSEYDAAKKATEQLEEVDFIIDNPGEELTLYGNEYEEENNH